jgi:hypothetical protein
MEMPVKGAPYSADEITESLQVLADGTRISHRSQVTVYRDGEGRVRRESPNEITISDPVANVGYTLHPASMTAVKSGLGRTTYALTHTATGSPASAKMTFSLALDQLDQLKADLAASGGRIIVDGKEADPQAAASLKEQLAVAMAKLSTAVNPPKTESLGQRLMQGETADGTRTTTTIEAGAIGNDRPIQVVSERWYSSDLRTVIMTKRTDPRTGEETFRLANVHRGKPGANLFLVPPGYRLTDSTAKWVVPSKNKE